MEVVALESGYLLASVMPGIDLLWGLNALIRQLEFWSEARLIHSSHPNPDVAKYFYISKEIFKWSYKYSNYPNSIFEVAKNFLEDMSM